MAQLKPLMKGPNEIMPFGHPYIKYPQLASTKMDGFRCLNLCGERLLSPNLKDIRNTKLMDYLKVLMDVCKARRWVTDGELWSPTRSFHMPVKEQGISSILTTHGRNIPSDIGYYIFDMMTEEDWDNGTEKTFCNRILNVQQTVMFYPNVHFVAHSTVRTPEEAQTMFDNHILIGHEGIILRSPTAKYKHGRTTDKQDGMWKFKEFLTEDGVIVGVEQQMKLKAGVERTTNELGHLERRYEQDLYEPAGMVGAFVVEHNGKRFSVKPGKGHDNNTKFQWWHTYVVQPEKLLGKHCEYKFMPHGTLDKPRIGSLVRFRPDLD